MIIDDKTIDWKTKKFTLMRNCLEKLLMLVYLLPLTTLEVISLKY